MGWQLAEFERIAACLPNAEVALHGSASEPPTLDGWSDLDLRIRTDQRVPVGLLTADATVWAYEDRRDEAVETCRMVLDRSRPGRT